MTWNGIVRTRQRDGRTPQAYRLRYVNEAVLGFDGKSWSADALILDTVQVSASRFTQEEVARYDQLTGAGLAAQIAGSIIDRQRAHDRAIANPANFSADLRLAQQNGIAMEELMAARAATLPRELRGAATMYDVSGGEIGWLEVVVRFPVRSLLRSNSFSTVFPKWSLLVQLVVPFHR